MIEEFRVGFIGCGSYSASLAKASRRAGLRPVICYDINAERARVFAQTFEITAAPDIDSLLSEDIEGVVIATPNNAHRANAEAAAAAGKHIFVDKPIANTLEDGLAIIDAARRAGLVLAVGHNGRRMAGHRKMKEMIDAGAVGTPITVEANFSHSGGLGLTPAHWRYHRDQCPGLPLMQLGVHFADTVQYLLGDVLEVFSFMSHVATPADSEDVTVSLLRFDGGLLGYLGSNYASPPVYYVNVYGTGGNLLCDGGSALRYRAAGSRNVEDVALVGAETQVEELEEFARCARSGAAPEVDGRAGLMALAVVRAALASHERKRPVALDDIIAEARSRLGQRVG